MEKRDLLRQTVEHIDFKTIDAVPLIDAYRKMSFTARAVAEAADIYLRMLQDPDCTVILTLAGSTSAAGVIPRYSRYRRSCPPKPLHRPNLRYLHR
jgi:deoxyhypusine synthase